MAKKEKIKQEKKQETKELRTSIIKVPLSTEKAMRLMGEENKLLFVVDRKANKSDVKREIETIFKTKVEKVNIYIAPDSKKRAWVKFAQDTPAVDIAATLGLI